MSCPKRLWGSLPQEILQKIIAATCDDGLHSINDTINYALVCKAWRTVILDTPVLRDDSDLSRKGTEDLRVLSIIDRYLSSEAFFAYTTLGGKSNRPLI